MFPRHVQERRDHEVVSIQVAVTTVAETKEEETGNLTAHPS